jgi:hypothetical protein
MRDDSVKVRPVLDKVDRNLFVHFPYQLYKDNACWVPPILQDQKVLLDPKKNPFYQHAESQFFLAFKDGRPAGRIAAIVDHKHNEFHNEKMGFFGFFECIEEFSVADGLLSAAKGWVMEKGMKAFRGPVNPSQNEDCGCLMNAYDVPPVLMMTYNPPYYPIYFEFYGLKKAMDLWAYYIDNKKEPPDKLVRVAEALRKKEGVVVRRMVMKKFDREVDKIKRIYNDAWSKNWGFVPMTDAEFDHLAKNLKPVVVPELGLIAEINGKPIAFSLSLPDMNQALIHINGRLFPFGLPKLLWYSRKIDMIRIVTLGVVHEYQKKGIDAILYLDTWRNALKKGYWRGEMSWILETNTMMNRTAEMLGGKVYKTYRMYQMDV